MQESMKRVGRVLILQGKSQVRSVIHRQFHINFKITPFIQAKQLNKCSWNSSFSTSVTNNSTIDSFPELNFHKICDHTLEELSDSLSSLDADLDDVDINLSQGVLSLNLGPKFQNKTWVINKQTPNRQIWWSSPISGPRRYEYVGDKSVGNNGKLIKTNKELPLAHHWRFSKNETNDLWNDLQQEIKQITSIEIELP